MSAATGKVRAAAARLPSGERTHTVCGTDGLPQPVVEEFLEHLRTSQASPHTVQAYARGMAAWWSLLEDRRYDWADIPSGAMSEFLRYLRTGDLPSVSRVGADPTWLSPASVQQRLAAVQAFYQWSASAYDDVASVRRLRRVSHRSGRYAPMLAGVGPPRSRMGPIARVRSTQGGRPPLLTPEQVDAIVRVAGTPYGPTGQLRATRDRLFFAMLPETGLRIGEALSLRHCDWHVGRGDTPHIEVVPRQDHPHGARVKNNRHRRLYVSDELEAAYSAYVWALVDAGIDLDIENLSQHWVFVNVAAGPRWQAMRPETIYDRVESITRKLGDRVPAGWSPHWMRHTHATALLLSGTQPHVVMRRLGHADIQTTISTYGWVTEDAEMRALSGWRKYAHGWEDLT
ncbi:tyrosine-type recombinase/integrase [Dermatophilaceae bacterium Sec6.4]